MPVKNVYDTIKQVIQDAIAPELREINGELKLLHTEIHRLDEKIDGVKNEFEANFKRLDDKIDGVKNGFEANFKRLDEKIDGVKNGFETNFKRLDDKIDSVKEDVRNLRNEFKLAIDIHERLATLETRIAISH